MKLVLWAVFLFVLSICNSHAMFVATRSGEISSTRPLRLIVVGTPGDLGRLMANSALVRARNYEDFDSTSQVVFLGIDSDMNHIASRGFRVVSSNRRLLRSSDISEVIKNSRAIKSFDIYSHSNVTSGAHLDSGRTQRTFLSKGDDVWSELSRKRMPETFVFLHGCNSGVEFAPWIARNVGVAAYGSLTGTNFQYIYQDSFWAFGYLMTNTRRTSRSDFGSHRVNNCQAGECVRMKPDNAVYRGYWGEWIEGGYPTYKLFCSQNNLRNCQAAAVHNIKTFPSVMPAKNVTSETDFKKMAMDFMCPDAQNSDRHSRCVRELERSLVGGKSTYSPFRGVILNCDLTDCKVRFECRRTIFGRVTNECGLVNLSTGSNTAFVDDFLFLMGAYQSLGQ
jgi:hypothetical protein